MLLSVLAPFLIVPFVVANGVHRLKLKKLPPAENHRALETAYLAHKYGAQSLSQVTLMGAGGVGRRVRCPSNADQDLYRTQVEVEGGHHVPLTSSLLFIIEPYLVAHTNIPYRLHERSVLCGN
jgi:saccharopepsin